MNALSQQQFNSYKISEFDCRFFFRKLNCNHSQKTRQASFLLLPSQFICKIGFRLTNHEALKFVKVGLTFVGVIRSLQKYSGAKNC